MAAQNKQSDANQPRVVDVIASEVAPYSQNLVFGCPGDKIDNTIDGFIKKGFRFILAHDELSAGFMASVTARLTGKLGVCLGMGAPGAARLVPGVLQAASDKVPVLAITGTVESYNYGSEYVQEENLLGLFSSFTVFNEILINPKSASWLSRMACRAAIARSGVANLTIPMDLQYANGGDPWLEPAQQVELEVPAPRHSRLEEAASVLNSAEKVVILAGRGSQNCSELLAKLAEKLGAPLFGTYTGRHALPANDSHVMGVAWGSKSVLTIIADADAILLVGTDYPYMKDVLQRKTKLIQIDNNPYNLAKRIPVAVPILADAREALQGILELTRPKQGPGYVQTARDILNDFFTRLSQEKMLSTAKPLNPYFVLRTLEQVFPEDSVIVVDGGSIGQYLMGGFDFKRQILVQGGKYASLGFALPAAIASQLVYPERTVLSCAGDFGMMYNLQEILTAVQNKLPVKIVVFNNRVQFTVKQGNERYRLAVPADPGELDFGSVARASGAFGKRVEEPSELKGALEELLSFKGPGLLDVRTSHTTYVHYRK
jgi:thiamine pyrophosphate-dependent acetolactate synthase large subunit-like protein